MPRGWRAAFSESLWRFVNFLTMLINTSTQQLIDEKSIAIGVGPASQTQGMSHAYRRLTIAIIARDQCDLEVADGLIKGTRTAILSPHLEVYA